MSGLGLLKSGKKTEFTERPMYRSSIDFDSFEVPKISPEDNIEEVGNEDQLDFPDSDSLASSKGPPDVVEEKLLPYDQVKKVMKGLKHALKSGATRDQILECVLSAQKLANTTYSVRSDLGERGMCEGLCQLFEKYIEDADITAEILKAISNMLISDDENKIRTAKLGACKLTIDAIKFHNEDPNILELCCKLIVDFGNGKFVSMLEADFRKREEQRDLRSRESNKLAATPNTERKTSSASTAAAEIAATTVQILDSEHAEEKSSKQRLLETSNFGPSVGGMSRRSNRGDASECVQNEEMWDNRLELCKEGACETLVGLLQNFVVNAPFPEEPHHIGLSQLHENTSLSSILTAIFEDEDVVVAACMAVASLSAHPTCSRRFGWDAQLARSLTSLLLQFKHWNLMTSASWAILNLCADPKSGNKERLGIVGAGENLCRGLVQLTNGHADYLEQPGFHRLLEYYIWALLNLIIACTHNQQLVKALEREHLFEQLGSARWVKPGVKDKARLVLKIMSRVQL